MLKVDIFGIKQSKHIMDYLFIFLIGVGIFYAIVAGIISKIKQHRRNKAAKEVLGSIDFKKEREEIRLASQGFFKKTKRCERCNGVMVLRQGVSSCFWGCSNYPRCNHTLQKV
ncbi:MAG: topoisomerase DNA-binding C4 zinc finger domain-containing protein [bacterium]